MRMHHYIKARVHRLSGQLHHLPRTMLLVWTASSYWTALWAALLVAQGLLPVATVYLTRALVNAMVTVVRNGGGWSTARPAIMIAILMGLVMLASEALRSLSTMAATAQSELTADHIRSLIHRKSAAVDLAFYETPECFDHLHRARTEGAYRPTAVVESVGGMIQNSITLVAMLGVLIPFGPLLSLTLLLSTVPAFLMIVHSGSRRFQWNQRRTALERSANYQDWVLTSHECAAEVRTFELGEFFRAAYQQARATLRGQRLALAKQQSASEMLAGAGSLAIVGGALALLVWRAILGLVSLGNLALFYQAFNQGLGVTRSLLENFGRLYENSLFLENLFEFLAFPSGIASPEAAAPMPSPIAEIEVRGVSFRYPGTGRHALRDFDLSLKAGQITALVGPNGAGKSTLLKLIARLYDPEQGTVSIDGIPLPALSLEEIHKAVAVVFQTPVHFNASAAQNIAFRDFSPEEKMRLQQAAAGAGIERLIADLPHGFNTLLGKQFLEGVELSTGEWQRVAIARALSRNAPVLLLDEPTSAMDPWAEIKWLEELRRGARNRITVLVTHRFTTAMFADVIHVVDHGRIVESGSHTQLLARKGLYAAGWAAQKGIDWTATVAEC